MNGFRFHFEDLRLVLSRSTPCIVCLQETHLRPHHSVKIRNFTNYRLDLEDGDRAHGGVATLVRNHVYSEQVPVTSNLQVICIKVILPTLQFTVCNIYIPPGQDITSEHLVNLFSQLPPPYLVVGDLNAHNPLWGSSRICARGRIVERALDTFNLLLLNTGLPTHLCLASRSLSSIDLAFGSPSLGPVLDWTVLDDLYGSDHYPALIHINARVPSSIRPPSWNFKQADWPTFHRTIKLSEGPFENVEAMVTHFTKAIIMAANKAVRKSEWRQNRNPVPWWNQVCAQAVRARKRALTRLNRCPSIENLIEYKKARSKARRTICESKCASWKAYTSSISSRTPSSTVWHKIRKIKGNSTEMSIPCLTINGQYETSPDIIAEEIASHFENTSNSSHYSPPFLIFKRSAENSVLDFSSSKEESYNIPFSMLELTSSLDLLKSTSSGPDQIHNLMLKNLPGNALKYLLRMYNRIWQDHAFPTQWCEATIIPIPKPGKDRTKSSNYRPISLTSCLCKLLERMINQRLVWSLESRNLLSSIQCGFRRQRSTVDHLATLATHISTSFALRQHLIAIFFDIEKAYDTTWRHGILRTLHSWGYRGHLPHFLSNFLSNRSFRIRLGRIMSDSHPLENGVPQGSVLSVTLFAIAINGIVSAVREPVKASLFVDDFAIYCSSRNISMAQRQLQLVLNRLQEWSQNTGFNFSLTKTCAMHFCRIYNLHNDPELFLGGHQLPFVESTRFLGLTFDRSLTWRHHIRNLQSRCVSPINLLRTLSGTSWGADRICLIRLYRALVRSLLDYGSIVYGSAAPSTLRPINSVHNAGIRISTGALRTSRIECLLAEAGEPPLSRRRDILLATYGAKISSLPNHPTHKAMLKPTLHSSYALRRSLPKPPGIRLYNLLQEMEINLPCPVKSPRQLFPPWKRNLPAINFTLCQFPKVTTLPFIYRQQFLEIKANYRDHTFVYTDGSVLNDSVACAFQCGDISRSFLLHPFCSIYSAEKYAILQALQFIQSRALRRVVICTDSKSSLQSISSLFSWDNLTLQIQNKIHHLISRNYNIVFCWVPGHVGISGNELADGAAKAATRRTDINIAAVPAPDTQTFLRHSILNAWQTEWQTTNFKLSTVKDTVKPWNTSFRTNRREEIILTRLRIGHTHFSHGFLVRGEPPPICETCKVHLSVEHVLLHCRRYESCRQRHSLATSLKEMLCNSEPAVSRLLSFLHECDLYKKI